MLANALNTSTDWILALTDGPDRDVNSGDLDESEVSVIKLLRSKDNETRQKIIDVIKVIAG